MPQNNPQQPPPKPLPNQDPGRLIREGGIGSKK